MGKIKEFMLQVASDLGKEIEEVTQEDFDNAVIEKYGVNLCRCNNCMGTFIDTNPQTGAKKYKDEGYRSLEFVKDDEGYCHGCPDCGTDAHLIDL